MLVGRASSRPRFALHVKPVASGEEDFRSRRVTALLGLSPAEAAIAVSPAESRTVREIAAATGR